VSSGREIGTIGTTARFIVGLLLLAPAATGRFGADEVLLGLGAFPAVVLAWQWLRRRRTQQRLDATGPIGFVINAVVFVALYRTPAYAPEFAVTSDAVLIFYGTSMLLAAVRGYAGCEVLAISNWVLRRNDQVGCLVFSPVDAIERRTRGQR
jgi:hypothetical protein